MRQLLPSSELRDPDLARLYAYPSGRWLRANMVSSADGAAILEGVTAGLSSRGDRHLFSLLRALADVIVVGAATARAEKYGPARQREFWNDLRQDRPPTPPIAVVSARLDLDPASRLIAAAPPHARTIVITTAQSPADRRADLAGRADVIVAGDRAVDLNAAVSALADRGYRRLLTEGGPRLLGQFIAAGLLDELCLSIGPLLAGPGASGIVAGALSASRPMPLELAHVLEDSGFLLCRYTRKAHLSELAVVRRSGQVPWPWMVKPRRRPTRHASHECYGFEIIVDRYLVQDKVTIHDLVSGVQGRGRKPPALADVVIRMAWPPGQRIGCAVMIHASVGRAGHLAGRASTARLTPPGYPTLARLSG